jgi:hypothetical protein
MKLNFKPNIDTRKAQGTLFLLPEQQKLISSCIFSRIFILAVAEKW